MIAAMGLTKAWTFYSSLDIIKKEGGKLMIYSIQEIQQRIAPIAKQYGLKAVFLFGSYARGEAREDSDIDLW